MCHSRACPKFASRDQARSHCAIHLSDATTQFETAIGDMRIALDQKVEGSNPYSPATTSLVSSLENNNKGSGLTLRSRPGARPLSVWMGEIGVLGPLD